MEKIRTYITFDIEGGKNMEMKTANNRLVKIRAEKAEAPAMCQIETSGRICRKLASAAHKDIEEMIACKPDLIEVKTGQQPVAVVKG